MSEEGQPAVEPKDNIGNDEAGVVNNNSSNVTPLGNMAQGNSSEKDAPTNSAIMAPQEDDIANHVTDPPSTTTNDPSQHPESQNQNAHENPSTGDNKAMASRSKIPIPSFDWKADESDNNNVETSAAATTTAMVTQAPTAGSDSDDAEDGDSSSEEEEEESEGFDSEEEDEAAENEGDPNSKLNSNLTDEGREMRIQRNKNYAVSAGLKEATPQKSDTPQEMTPLLASPPLVQPVRGMVFATPYNTNNPPNRRTHQMHHHIMEDNIPRIDEAEIMEDLHDQYPCREMQVQRLWCLLSPALPPPLDDSYTDDLAATISNGSDYIPPPIFVTGPGGTGKSTVVRDIVNGLKRSRSQVAHYFSAAADARIGSAYINCATLDAFVSHNSSSNATDEILHSAYRQLAQDMKAGRTCSSGDQQWRLRRKRRKIKNPRDDCQRKKQRVDIRDDKKMSASDAKRVSFQNSTEGSAKGNNDPSSDATKQATDAQSDATDKVDNHDEEETLQPRRSQRVMELTENEAGSAPTFVGAGVGGVKVSAKVTKLMDEINADLSATTNVAALEGDLTASSSASSRAFQVAAATFGQELKENLFVHKNDCAFLILDQAEKLFSLATSSSPRTNFLSQLLLLPQTKGLNLTIIVISKSILLEHARFNNIVAPEKSFATLSTAIQPLHVHFQAYKGKETFKKILLQPMLLERIVGPGMLSSFQSGEDVFSRQLVKAFLNSLVQSLYGSIRDLKEVVRLGRLLWPIYVRPIHSSNIEGTMRSIFKMNPSAKSSGATTESHGKHILAFLDQQILPQTRLLLDQCMYTCTDLRQPQHPVSTTNTTMSHANGSLAPGRCLKSQFDVNASYLNKILMLAAFICQTNRADRDKQLFTIQKNGKKNNASKKNNPGEDIAFGAARTQKAPKNRMFPMERMLSVFVSIVGLNQRNLKSKSSSNSIPGKQINPGRIGSSDFFEALAHLRDTGVLHEKAGTPVATAAAASETINMANPRFWCSLTKDEADFIATSVNFPLDNYLY